MSYLALVADDEPKFVPERIHRSIVAFKDAQIAALTEEVAMLKKQARRYISPW